MSELIAMCARGYINDQLDQHTYQEKRDWNEHELEKDISNYDFEKEIRDLNDNTTYFFDMDDFSRIKKDVIQMENFNYKYDMSSHKYSLIKELIFVIENNTCDFNWGEIMNIKIGFTIGKSLINGNSIPMEYNILLCNLLGKQIKEKNNIVKVRCAFFELLKNNFLNYSKFKNLDGFFFSPITRHNISITITTETKNLNLKLIIKYRKLKNILKNICGVAYEIPIFGFNLIQNLSEYNNLYDIGLSLINKFLIIKIMTDDYDLLNIQSINLYLNGLDPIIFNIYQDEIQEMSLFDNKYIIISLSPSFKNISKLCDNLRKGNIDQYGINMSRIDDIHIGINDISPQTNIDICGVYVNIAKVMDGMMGTAYAF